MATILVAVFCEDDFERIEQCESVEYARGFCGGFCDGAEAYGGGSFGAYVLPENESAMREDQGAPAVEKALRAAADIRARIGE